MSEPIRVVLVDDHPLLREGVAATLDADPAFTVVGQGASAGEALQLATSLLPDLMLLDLNMPGGGLNAARAVTQACPVTRLVMLTVSEDEADVLAALKAGARGFVLKGVSGRELRSILTAICAGEVYVTPGLAASMLRDLSTPRPATASPLDDLTARERQILEGVAAGQSNKEIARGLDLTEKTVKHYMTNVLQKLQVRNRVEAALLAQKAQSGK